MMETTNKCSSDGRSEAQDFFGGANVPLLAPTSASCITSTTAAAVNFPVAVERDIQNKDTIPKSFDFNENYCTKKLPDTSGGQVRLASDLWMPPKSTSPGSQEPVLAKIFVWPRRALLARA